MPDLQSSDMCHIPKMISAFPLASARLRKLGILIVLLNENLCKNIVYFHIFSIFGFLNMNLSAALILPVSQLQTQKVMTSQIRSHIEYLIQSYHILVLIL